MIATILSKIFKKETSFNKKDEVYFNGADNDYPETIDRLINNSVTAKTCTNLMIQYLIGKGFGEADELVIGRQGLRVIDFVDDVANSKVRQRGLFIHVNWNANFKIDSLQLLPFTDCRVGKKDSANYNGKIGVKNWQEKTDETEWVDVYNPMKEVIQAQVEKAGGWGKYKGQILYINDDTDYIYPLSRIDAVMGDCDNENQVSIYKNTILRKGFFGKTLVLTPPMIDSNIEESIVNEKGELIKNPEYIKAKSERDKFKETIEEFYGAENVGGVMHVETEFNGEKLEDSIVFKNIESKIDPNLFKEIETSLRKNIALAFNNVPIGLIEQSDGIFTASGEAITQMQKQYWFNTEKERNRLEAVVNMLFKLHKNYNGQYLKIMPYDFASTNIT
jgi:hypothetical protein